MPNEKTYRAFLSREIAEIRLEVYRQEVMRIDPWGDKAVQAVALVGWTGEPDASAAIETSKG
jgi:hypothetical protein